MRKKMAIEGRPSQKYKGKKRGGGGQEKYFSKTLKWHNIFILKKTRYRTNIDDRIQSYYKLSSC